DPGASAFTQVGTATGTSYSDLGLAPASAYSYRVRASDAAGNLGPFSNTAGATTADTLPPSAPANLAAAARGTQITLTWAAATDNVLAPRDPLARQDPGASAFAQVGTATGTTYSDPGLTPASAYSYRVRAADAAGNLGPYSNTAGATTADTQAP